MFVDEVDIHVAAGNGGRGCLAFRREKFVPRGGPSGGDGGHGGSVYVVASPHTNTLINYRFHPELTAERGDHGQGSNRTGRTGADLELAVPIGTLVYEKSEHPGEPQTLLADLATEGQRVLVARPGAAAWATRISRHRPTGRRARCSQERRANRRTCASK
jgi:GTP-binding protein